MSLLWLCEIAFFFTQNYFFSQSLKQLYFCLCFSMLVWKSVCLSDNMYFFYVFHPVQVCVFQRVCVSMCLCVNVSVCQRVFVSTCLCVNVSVCQRVCVSTCLCANVSVCQRVCVSTCLCVFVPVSLFMQYLCHVSWKQSICNCC